MCRYFSIFSVSFRLHLRDVPVTEHQIYSENFLLISGQISDSFPKIFPSLRFLCFTFFLSLFLLPCRNYFLLLICTSAFQQKLFLLKYFLTASSVFRLMGIKTPDVSRAAGVCSVSAPLQFLPFLSYLQFWVLTPGVEYDGGASGKL